MFFSDIVRYDDNMWAHRHEMSHDTVQEIRVITPDLDNEESAYRLAGSVLQFLVHPPSASDCYKLSLTEPAELAGVWLVEDITNDWYMDQSKGGFTIYRFAPNDLNTSRLCKNMIGSNKVWRILPGDPSYSPVSWWKDWPHFKHACSHFWSEPISIETLSPPELPIYEVGSRLDPVLTMKEGCFKDPFTSLARAAFQRSEHPFVAEKDLQSSSTFVVKEGKLSLESQPVSKEDARRAKELYFEYARAVYGTEVIDVIEKNLNIAFEQMDSISPDIVFRMNVGAQYVMNLAKLIGFHRQINQLSNHTEMTLSLRTWEDFLHQFPSECGFPLREIRGIYSYALKKFPGEDFVSCGALFSAFWGKSVRDLSLQACDDLIGILIDGFDLTPGAANEEMFTGRNIRHLPICGYKTMGDRTEFDPTRNWFELLHIYPGLSRGIWNQSELSFYELLVHVFVKKSPLDVGKGCCNRIAGRLLPGPVVNGTRTWYSVQSFSNDQAGDLNYFLTPVSSDTLNGKMWPAIKLFRSTASDPEAESSLDSIRADLNPFGVGSLNEDNNDEYEIEDLYSCTIPLWLGYLAQEDFASAEEAFDTYVGVIGADSEEVSRIDDVPSYGNEQVIIDCLNSLRQSDDGAWIWNRFASLLGPRKRHLLLCESCDRKEWTGSIVKKRQDVLFMGHSLGGALAQQSLVHFIGKGRIPLPGCNYICYCFDSPGTTFENSEEFMAFGKRHASLLRNLNQKWEVHFQFEKEDLVPQGGEIFLGTEFTDPTSQSWFSFTAHIYTPLFNTVKALEVGAMPTHGRRFHLAQEGEGHDFIMEELMPEELRILKTGWRFQAASVMEKFGYKTLPPWLTEKIRTVAGFVSYPFISVVGIANETEDLGNACRVNEREIAH